MDRLVLLPDQGLVLQGLVGVADQAAELAAIVKDTIFPVLEDLTLQALVPLL
jgi:hypothetical protein